MVWISNFAPNLVQQYVHASFYQGFRYQGYQVMVYK